MGNAPPNPAVEMVHRYAESLAKQTGKSLEETLRTDMVRNYARAFGVDLPSD